MRYFFAYNYVMGTGETGTGNCVLELSQALRDQRDINLVSNQIRNNEFEKGTNVAIIIINFIKL